jgi:large repetitive protein
MISPTSLRLLLILPLALSACVRDGVVKGDAGPDGGTPDTGGNQDGGIVTECQNGAIDPAPNGETCSFTAGGGATLIRGDIITPDGLMKNGHVLIGSDGKITCASCDCSSDSNFSGASVVACASGLVSPGLINAHEHLGQGEGSPTAHGDERFEHRQDWRDGQFGHTRLSNPPTSQTDEAILYAELRSVIAGVTSINGAGGRAGLARNLDREGLDEGLALGTVQYSTFPLGDLRADIADRRTTDCGYPDLDSPTSNVIAGSIAYTPHISEGTDLSARNEFVCLSGQATDGVDLIFDKTAVIHGIGMLASDYALMSDRGASLIWSARTNIDLYGHTAPVTLAANLGMQIALGTDWPTSGSMNALRELTCMSEYNARNLGGFFTDRQLVDMATKNGADVLRVSAALGTLATGKTADIAIFDQRTNAGYLAMLKGRSQDVALVMRGGSPLFGDAELVAGLTSQDAGCETMDVCGSSKRICVQRDTGLTLSAVTSAVRAETVELFYCDTPPGEPTCIPFRVGEFDGMPTSGDQDGDGVPDTGDNCPAIFNPARDNLDMNAQANADGDSDGDVCDPCPLDADSTTCTPADPDDRDKDGIPNDNDNCPNMANADQADRDSDQIGDLCDQCPDQPNAGGAVCVVSVYDVKQGNVTGTVRLNDMLVIAPAARGYFVQTVPGDDGYDASLAERFSGIFVFNGADEKPAVGDRIDIQGNVTDFFGQTEIANSTFTLVSSGDPPPAPIDVTAEEVATGAARAMELEAVLVRVGMVTVTELEPMAGPGDTAPTYEFVVEGILRVNDFLYRADPFPMVNDVIPNLQGILRFGNNNSKLEPRGPDDLGIPPRLSGFEPADIFARTGLNNAVPAGGLAVLLSRPTDVAVTVNLSAVGLTVPPTVEIAAAGDRADIPITTAAAGTATITASYGGLNASARVTVYDDASPRSVVDLTLDRTTVAVNDMVGGMVRIDAPGAVGGTQVNLQVTPNGLATVPASITVAEGMLSAPFTLTAGANTGSGMLTASADIGSRQVAFMVSASVDRPPRAAGDLVITEIHRNPSVSSAEENNEWFELYNPTPDGILIDGLEVSDNNASVTLTAPGVAIPSGGYAVIAHNLEPGTNGGVDAIASYGMDLLLANTDDVVRIAYQATEIDMVDWASGWPGSNGVSMCLRFPYAADNNVMGSWGASAGSFGTGGDMGSPGLASDATNCP